MTTSAKPLDTRTQLKNLMSQHTAATYARPAAPIATPRPTSQPMAPLQRKAAAATERFTVRLLPIENQHVDTLTLEAHQRLGERITVSDLLRIGLSRIGANSPVTAEELAALRTKDRRRIRAAGQGDYQGSNNT
jgi:hypothetical protein